MRSIFLFVEFWLKVSQLVQYGRGFVVAYWIQRMQFQMGFLQRSPSGLICIERASRGVIQFNNQPLHCLVEQFQPVLVNFIDCCIIAGYEIDFEFNLSHKDCIAQGHQILMFLENEVGLRWLALNTYQKKN